MVNGAGGFCCYGGREFDRVALAGRGSLVVVVKFGGLAGGVCCGAKRKGLCRSCVCDVLYTRRLEVVDEGSIEGVKERGILIRMERFGKLKVVSVHLL